MAGFEDEGKHWNLRVFETNFIHDIRRFQLDPYPARGNRTAIMRMSMASTSYKTLALYKMLAFRGGGVRFGYGRSYDPARTTQSKNVHDWTYMIPFEREDPAIREEYDRELERMASPPGSSR